MKKKIIGLSLVVTVSIGVWFSQKGSAPLVTNSEIKQSSTHWKKLANDANQAKEAKAVIKKVGNRKTQITKFNQFKKSVKSASSSNKKGELKKVISYFNSLPERSQKRNRYKMLDIIGNDKSPEAISAVKKMVDSFATADVNFAVKVLKNIHTAEAVQEHKETIGVLLSFYNEKKNYILDDSIKNYGISSKDISLVNDSIFYSNELKSFEGQLEVMEII
ncbi:MAG: sulfur relay (sulfurtransferase) DsrF/TusC family protein [Thermoproteota archaeon]|jgi:sulfur relay (sulfurtransferase) DsrF/TusC family protein